MRGLDGRPLGRRALRENRTEFAPETEELPGVSGGHGPLQIPVLEAGLHRLTGLRESRGWAPVDHVRGSFDPVLEACGLTDTVQSKTDPATGPHFHARHLTSGSTRGAAMDELFQQSLSAGISQRIGEVPGASAVAFDPFVEHGTGHCPFPFCEMG